MDYEGVLRELFPQIDARLIKAIVLDGDDLESAVDFLVKEGVRSDGIKSGQTVGESGHSLKSSITRIDETDISRCLSLTCSWESTDIPAQTEKNTAPDSGAEELNEISGDKHEESIVWKGGLRNPLRSASVNDYPTDNTESFSEVTCGNTGNPSSCLLPKLESHYVSRCGQEILHTFNSKSSLESDHFGLFTEKNYDSGAQDSNASLKTASFAPTSASLQLYNLTFSEQGMELHTSVSEQQPPSTQQLEMIEEPSAELLIDLEQQPLNDGLWEKVKLEKFASPIPADVKGCNSETTKTQEAASVPMHWERIAWEFSLGDINSSQVSLKDGPFTSSNEAFETVGHVGTPKPTYDQSVSGELAYGDGVARGSTNESSRHNVNIEDLDECFHAARRDKEYLLREIEDIRLLRVKTEKEEATAHHAKDEASKGGLQTLLKVEDMRQRLSQMRADNEMRAAEIYGEKAVLSTEARELNSRLEETRLEQNKALNTINEVRSCLLARLEIAIKKRDKANEEKEKREQVAQDLLSIEEASFEKVIQETRDLDTEPEACTRLREFLMDRGSLVDSIQGEMAVLYEDVETFKKQVEEGILLASNHSLSMSHVSHLTEEFPFRPLKYRQDSATSSQDVETAVDEDETFKKRIELLASNHPLNMSHVSHLTEEFPFSPLSYRQNSATSSKELQKMAFNQAETVTEGSTMALAGSESSSCRSLKYFVSRTSSCFNSDGTGSIHSAIGFEDLNGGMLELPIDDLNGGMLELSSGDKDLQAVASALCTDYFSPNNSVVDATSEKAVSHDCDTGTVNASCLEPMHSENGLDDLHIHSEEQKGWKLVKTASNATDDLQRWHIQSDDDDWHMLGTQQAKKGSLLGSTSSSNNAQLVDKVVWEFA